MPTLASEVTMLEPYSTTVGSLLYYRCQESGFISSQTSSVCGEDGRWDPNPTQVVCMFIPPPTGAKEHTLHINIVLILLQVIPCLCYLAIWYHTFVVGGDGGWWCVVVPVLFWFFDAYIAFGSWRDNSINFKHRRLKVLLCQGIVS